MPTNAVLLEIDGNRVAQALAEAFGKLEVGGELVLDFSSVGRLDSEALHALEILLAEAEEKGIKLALKGVGVDVYKVLKLTKLAARFSFVN